jgi:2,5-diketo-D-gluconate reductase A
LSLTPTIKLRDGHTMPALGFGLWQIGDAEAESAAAEALRVGYRSFDGAQLYQNEAGLGRAIAKSGVPREQLFITTKVWNNSQGAKATAKAFDESLAKLQLDYVDLYLVHWPAPKRGLYLETWKALIGLKKQGRARSIGVSNFEPEHLRAIIEATGEVPVLNQIELHPRFAQTKLREFHDKHGIVTEAWSPLGKGKLLDEPTLVALGEKHGRSSAQVVLRWHLQHGIIVIPKSVTPSRIRENIDVFDFQLDAGDMSAIDGLDRGDGRIGPDPLTATF